MLRIFIAPIAAIALMFGLAACSPAEVSAGSPTVTVSEQTIVLDVRTPDEYASGHLSGATLLDLSGGQFAAALPSLDPEAEYVVYCRSGNRSSQAVAMMVGRGITNVTDLGAIGDAASATGLPVVTE